MRAAWMALSLMLVMPAVHAARIYRWVGPDSKVYYGDIPPSDARSIESLGSNLGASTTPPPAPAESPEVAAKREVDCAAKRAQLDTYLTATRLIEKDAQGRERELTGQERELLVALSRTRIESQCGEAVSE